LVFVVDFVSFVHFVEDDDVSIVQTIDDIGYHALAALQYLDELVLLHRSKWFVECEDDGSLMFWKQREDTVDRHLQCSELVDPSQLFVLILSRFPKFNLELSDDFVQCVGKVDVQVVEFGPIVGAYQSALNHTNITLNPFVGW
jgi:hypothetical protein